MRRSGYVAYAHYQHYATVARARYVETKATVWAYIATACVSLSLTEQDEASS